MITIDEKNLANLFLTSNSSGENQFIYASQIYETSFGVYGDFSVNTDGSIESISLIILNYKGSIDLGFHNAVQPKCTLVTQQNSQGETMHIVKIDFELRAVVSGETSYRQDVLLDSTLDSLKNIPENEDLYLFVDRELVPIWGSRTENPLKNGIFDNEFFYRDGTRFEVRNVTNVPENYYINNSNKVYPTMDFYQKPGYKCRNSTLRIIRKY